MHVKRYSARFYSATDCSSALPAISASLREKDFSIYEKSKAGRIRKLRSATLRASFTSLVPLAISFFMSFSRNPRIPSSSLPCWIWLEDSSWNNSLLNTPLFYSNAFIVLKYSRCKNNARLCRVFGISVRKDLIPPNTACSNSIFYYLQILSIVQVSS